MARDDVLVVGSERFRDHATPAGHPERPDRAEVMTAVVSRWRTGGGRTVEPAPATDAALERVHASPYVRSIGATAGRRVRLDPDTYAAPESEAVARLAAGAALAAVDHALDRDAIGLALVRPPGHHAERERAMGFCLYNNAAVAAAHALDRGLERVAVVDYDVHHGNGTQWIFYDDPRVLYLSTHQYPFYPGTGAADDVGRGDGAGFTVNIPLAAGAGDADLDRVFREVAVPVLAAYEPELIVLSAGYDAHADDPLGGMRVTTGGFATLDRRLRAVAERSCRGRMAVVTEGGYDLAALEACLEGTLEVAAGAPPGAIPGVEGASPAAEAALAAVRPALRAFWPTL
ncbi:MAG: histone deacetylase [Acidobacteria bacterium]|nr:histone deacetylase [Acidobacteriota bacterium]